MEAIVAVFSDWGIGSEGTQQLVLKADRAHFRELTAGAAVIVGRRTLADFPGGRPLKGRHNIVLTRQDLSVEGAEVAHSAEEAAALAAKYPRALVIGGASVYRQLLPWVDLAHVTQIDLAPSSLARAGGGALAGGKRRALPLLDLRENIITENSYGEKKRIFPRAEICALLRLGGDH